jgi:cell wall-associated NlpC family hydrolase
VSCVVSVFPTGIVEVLEAKRQSGVMQHSPLSSAGTGLIIYQIPLKKGGVYVWWPGGRMCRRGCWMPPLGVSLRFWPLGSCCRELILGAWAQNVGKENTSVVGMEQWWWSSVDRSPARTKQEENMEANTDLIWLSSIYQRVLGTSALGNYSTALCQKFLFELEVQNGSF